MIELKMTKGSIFFLIRPAYAIPGWQRYIKRDKEIREEKDIDNIKNATPD